MTATAVSSLTVEPAALLVCVNQSASIHDHIIKAGLFCVNLLGPEHADLCSIFSGKLKGDERFRHGMWLLDPNGMPYLADGQASISCQLDAQTTYGTHSIFVGQVESVRLQNAVQPLVYQAGTLGQFQAIAG
jgi:flavin reductase (DIM6/NTAB) family NADH-FMN oxidoreductase RutF